MGGSESKLSSNDLKKMFKDMDKNGDGSISIEEIKAGLMKKYSDVVDDEIVQFFFKSMDSDGNGEVDRKEFDRMIGIVLELLKFKHKNQDKMTESKKKQEQKLITRFSFKVADVDGDGVINVNELKRYLDIIDQCFDTSECMNIIKSLGGNDTLTYEQFLTLLDMEL